MCTGIKQVSKRMVDGGRQASHCQRVGGWEVTDKRERKSRINPIKLD